MCLRSNVCHLLRVCLNTGVTHIYTHIHTHTTQTCIQLIISHSFKQHKHFYVTLISFIIILLTLSLFSASFHVSFLSFNVILITMMMIIMRSFNLLTWQLFVWINHYFLLSCIQTLLLLLLSLMNILKWWMSLWFCGNFIK